MLPTAEAQRNRFFAQLYSPAASRNLLQPLLGIETQTGESLRPGLDHAVAHTRLQWWADECARCVAGEAVHPLTRQLAAACSDPQQQLRGLAGLVATNIWDLARATFASRSELTAYCGRWSQAMLGPLAGLPGLPAVLSLGSLLCELELLLAVATEARAGRLRLPLDELDAQRVPAENLCGAPFSPGLAQLLLERHAALREGLAAQIAALQPPEQMRLRGVLVWAALTVQSSVRAQAALPAAPQVSRGRMWSDGWHAWRAARRAAAGRLVI